MFGWIILRGKLFYFAVGVGSAGGLKLLPKNIFFIFLKVCCIFKKHCYNINAGRNTLYTHETELTFKRHVMSSDMGESRRKAAFSILRSAKY